MVSTLIFRRWQPHSKDAAFTRLAGYMDISAAQVEDDPADGKAQAVALLFPGGISLIKLLKNVFLSLLRHSDAPVRDSDGDIVVVLAQGDGDGGAGIGKLDSVADQVGPHLEQQGGLPGVG